MIRVLYVDDDPIYCDLVKQYLEESGGFTVVTPGSARAALASDEAGRCDVIVSDYQMAGLDGIGFLQKIRAGNNPVPFILFTGRGREDVAIGALNAGADSYLQKGTDPDCVFAELAHRIRAIARQARAERELKESEERFRELFRAMNSGVAVYGVVDDGADFVFHDFNSSAEKIDGLRRSDVIGRRVTEIFPGIREFGLFDILQRVSRTGQPEHHPVSRYRDGRIDVWRENYVYRLSSGEVVAVYNDITARIRAEEAVRESEEKYRTLFNRMARGVFYQRADGTLVDVNPAALKMLGLTREQFLGTDSYDPRWEVRTEDGSILAPEDHPSMVALRTGTPVRNLVVGVFVPGRDEYTWVSVSAEPQFRPGETRPYQVFVVMDDITEKRKAGLALDALVRSIAGTTGSRSLQAITENLASWLSADCVLIGEIRPGTQSLEILAMLLDKKESRGTSSRINGTPFEETIHAGFAACTDNVSGSFADAGDLPCPGARGYIGTLIRNGQGDALGILAIFSRSPLTADGETKKVLGILASKAGAEIERLKRGEALQESEERYRALVDNALEAIFIFDFSGTMLFANRAVAVLLDSGDPRGFAGRNAFEFLAPESRADAMSDFAQVRDGWDGYPARYKLITTTGQEKWVESIGKRIQYKGEPACITMIRDITGRVRAEEALKLANKKLSLLTSITRHDIRNQILPLNAYLALIKKNAGEREKVYEFLEKAGQIVATIERQILFTKEYEDMGKSDPVWQNAAQWIGMAAKDRTPGPVTLDYAAMDGVEILAAPLLQKVFSNLIDNAIRHGGSGLTTIRFSHRRDKDRLVILCQDNGTGIPDGEKEEIFGRGYGKNTGYGLFFIREVLGISGISISETGDPGSGARFEISVPDGDWRYSSRTPGRD